MDQYAGFAFSRPCSTGEGGRRRAVCWKGSTEQCTVQRSWAPQRRPPRLLPPSWHCSPTRQIGWKKQVRGVLNIVKYPVSWNDFPTGGERIMKKLSTPRIGACWPSVCRSITRHVDFTQRSTKWPANNMLIHREQHSWCVLRGRSLVCWHSFQNRFLQSLPHTCGWFEWFIDGTYAFSCVETTVNDGVERNWPAPSPRNELTWELHPAWTSLNQLLGHGRDGWLPGADKAAAKLVFIVSFGATPNSTLLLPAFSNAIYSTGEWLSIWTQFAHRPECCRSTCIQSMGKNRVPIREGVRWVGEWSSRASRPLNWTGSDQSQWSIITERQDPALIKDAAQVHMNPIQGKYLDIWFEYKLYFYNHNIPNTTAHPV